VLKFDISDFFPSINHKLLKTMWAYIMNVTTLPEDHYTVFKQVTQYRTIALDQFRVNNYYKGKRLGFDEKQLDAIRKTGIKSFFKSSSEFRKQLKMGFFRVTKNKEKGIPQGLSISPILANLYLLEFDKWVIKQCVEQLNCFYRRYSDDLIFVCNFQDLERIKTLLTQKINTYFLEWNEKSAIYLFKQMPYNLQGHYRLTAIRLFEDEEKIDYPLTYLGFEYRGYNVTLKSSHIAKYYQRMFQQIKKQAFRTRQALKKNPNHYKGIYWNVLKRYTAPKKFNTVLKTYKNYILKKNTKGVYAIYPKNTYRILKQRFSPHYTFLKQTTTVFNSSHFEHQFRKKKKLLALALKKHFKLL
jgi:hypothetical protein